MPILSQICVYPVKSLAGFPVTQWPVDRTGLRYDRKWMLVDNAGKFLSQRRLPAMALVRTGIAGGRLVVSAPGFPDLELDLDEAAGEELPIEIWADSYPAPTVDVRADDWFSQVLQFPCRLVYHSDQQMRQVDPDYALAGDETAFSDGFPFLLVSQASLLSLNAAMGLELTMARFRPNLVAADCGSYAEDVWRRIEINGIGFRLPKPCSRCGVTTVDPETALSGKEPLATLAKLRLWRQKVYFGQNALHDAQGVLSVGSPILIRETGPAQPPL